ncbi:NUDIX domain-containing protein [Corynebacterium poyangense]|uniref:NUDIX domain-containing protein n=1 Tax=Corynebacterium poyangense TaxID=2684405 RepID=A0A7H0SPY1_9CORY|nr:NUDIX domain-containing protein [Corynebacterium poyangense]QNQ90606.1 NUDIX domain-containing protein [Corynebacterium poyangense]
MPTPDFVVELREKVGHDLLYMGGVTALVIRDVAPGSPVWEVPEVLLVKRKDTEEWTPITGIIEPGHEPDDTARREVWEETGIEAQVEALLGVGEVGPVTYPNGDQALFLDTAIRLSQVGEEQPCVHDDENIDVGWFKISQLPPMKPRFRLVIADAVAQMKHPQGFRPRMGYHKRNL